MQALVGRCGEPGKCPEAEGVAGWESLRAWIAGSPQPNADVLQGTCLAIAAGGLASGPCRFDPSFVIPDMDGRIAPRGKMHGDDDNDDDNDNDNDD